MSRCGLAGNHVQRGCSSRPSVIDRWSHTAVPSGAVAWLIKAVHAVIAHAWRRVLQ